MKGIKGCFIEHFITFKFIGVQLFDKDGYKILETLNPVDDPDCTPTETVLKDDERIIGFKSK